MCPLRPVLQQLKKHKVHSATGQCDTAACCNFLNILVIRFTFMILFQLYTVVMLSMLVQKDLAVWTGLRTNLEFEQLLRAVILTFFYIKLKFEIQKEHSAHFLQLFVHKISSGSGVLFDKNVYVLSVSLSNDFLLR